MSTPVLSAGTPAALPAEDKPFVPPRLRWLRKHPTLFIGALLLLAMVALAIAAPWAATHDPQDI
ncbi:MAG: peptide ABC transporter permease, partial [Variovorax paradoxus]